MFCEYTSFLWTVQYRDERSGERREELGIYIPADWVLELVGVATWCGVTGEGAEEWRI